MEEDVGVKAPATRLRRRLSVEQTEENKSPAISLSTKKRGGRKAAIPELPLIDENTSELITTQRSTIKTALKDESEEKVVTPSRRSTRIKSNTSIISETAVPCDSPRTKRAARRASQAGSDNEASVTPIRQTRRTRKDSSSSIEKEPQLSTKQGIQITEAIEEEPEINSRKSPSHSDTTIVKNVSPNSTRKSLRLLKKTSKTLLDEGSNDIPLSTPDSTILRENNTHSVSPLNLSSQDNTDDTKHDSDIVEKPKDEIQTSQENRLSISSANLTKELRTDIKTKTINLNKSLPNAESKQTTTKRNRTKSLTPIPTPKDSQFHSVTEDFKSKVDQNVKSPIVLIKKSESMDKLLNISLCQDKSNNSISKRKSNDDMNLVLENGNESLDVINNIKNDIENKTYSFDQNNTKQNVVITSELLEKDPSGGITSLVIIEDSDSDSREVNIKRKHVNEDQCVPVTQNPAVIFPLETNSFIYVDENEQNNRSNKSKRKDSCEPMDIDETISESLKLENAKLETPGRKSISACDHIYNLSSVEITNKSQRSSINQCLDKSGIETKSTLILSQIKDSSTGDINKVANSPQVTNKLLSKSVQDLNMTQENDIKKNVSLHYSTSTPLQDKAVQKFKEIHVNPLIVISQSDDSPNNSIKQSANLFNNQYSNSKNEKSESSDVDGIKDFSDNKNKIVSVPSKISIDIEIERKEKELVEKIKTDDETSNTKSNKVNNKDVDILLQQNESNSNKISVVKKGNNPVTILSNKNSPLTSSSDSEEVESDDESQENSDFINDEAIDAGADYHSGDSQDESERRYEKENEILDHGETLTTEDDISDDSDYTKDSFIVSSNDEDEELLEGTDDDLSMSDNELKMTAKSKKKYDDRKIKEQKKASREMFDSRHKLNASKNNTQSDIVTTKKHKRQLLSSSESEDDVPIKPKKNNRLRLDSTKEASLLEDKSEHKISKKKNNRLSISISDISASDEKEITLCNKSIKESDPLPPNHKKKTPQNSVNTTLAFIDSEHINNDQIDKNESTKTQTELFDPLQVTMTAEDDDSLSSDNENIVQDYDSLLKDLNKSSKLKPKLCDISLNLEKKRKRKEKSAIIDELNLTQTKSVKKLKNKQKKKVENSIKEILTKTDPSDRTSSDSIDLHLLFSEDSSNSDDVENKKKGDSSNLGDFVSLKRIEEETDIRENEGKNLSVDASLNKSINKKNKKRKSESKENTSNNEEIFFIDTVGTHDNSLNKSHNISLKEYSRQPIENIDDAGNSDDEAPIEVSYKKEKSSKRQSKIKELDTLEGETGYVADKSTNKSLNKTPGSEKKMNKLVMNEELSILIDDQKDTIETANSDTNKRKKSSQSFIEDIETVPVQVNEEIVKTRLKKRKRKSPHNAKGEGVLPTDDAVALNESLIGNKKKKRKISPQDEILIDAVSETAQEEIEDDEHQQNNKSTESNVQNNSTTIDVKKKRNRKRKQREDDDANQISKLVKENNVFGKVTRLPPSILMKLDDQPSKKETAQKPKTVSTTQFLVQQTVKRKNKPSDYLEDSVYLNTDESKVKKKKKRIEKPKVLPFVPTASTSSYGYTTNFKVNVVPGAINFTAQSSTVDNFKDNYMYNNSKIRRLGTYEKYKRQRIVKMSKF